MLLFWFSIVLIIPHNAIKCQTPVLFFSNSNYGVFKKEIVRGRAQRPAPTFLKIAIILEFIHRFVGAALRGRPIIRHN